MANSVQHMNGKQVLNPLQQIIFKNWPSMATYVIFFTEGEVSEYS